MTLWIGDSHCLFFNQQQTVAVLSRAENMSFVWALGPRLMWSISRQGFPLSLRLTARVLNPTGTRSGRFLPIVCLGEIDVRCHLASPSITPNLNMSFVSDYVDKGQRLATSIGAGSVIFVVPVPPGADWAAHSEFPIVGLLNSRLEAFASLRTALVSAVQEGIDHPRAYLLDSTDILADSGGQLHDRLTADGCHVNQEGALLVHERLLQLVERMKSDKSHGLR